MKFSFLWKYLKSKQLKEVRREGAGGGGRGVTHAVWHSQLIVSVFVFLFPLKMSCVLITAGKICLD
jgi:hypothetical protein